MKKSTDYLWKLGMFISVGLLLLTLGIYIIGSQKNLFNPVFRMKTIFTDVSGLKVGNNVRFSGINVGTIDNISITSDSTVKVEFIVQKEVQKFIRKDSRASIGSEGLMGDKVLIIMPGSSDSPEAVENDFIFSDKPTDMEEIMASVKISADNIEIITDQLARITYNINNGKGAIARLIKDDKFANQLNQTMSNLQEGSKSMTENMEAAKSNVLLRGFFKKKKKEKEKKEKETLEKKMSDKKQ
jgi:phospholipid/cholesterol/gamma-HCH transport system substrate-binding protein